MAGGHCLGLSFSLDILDPARLIVTWDPGCEDAVQMLGPEHPGRHQQQQQPDGPIVRAQLSRDESGHLRLRLSCSCDGTGLAAAAVTAVDNGNCHLSENEPEDDAGSDDDEVLRIETGALEESVQRESSASNGAVAEATSSSYASALEEFVATERTYVRRLGLVFDVYYAGLRTAVQERRLDCCGLEDLKRVFGHFQGMRLLHEQLLSDLLQSDQPLGKLMCQYGHQLKSYSTYYSIFPQTTATVRGWMTDEAFRREFAQLRQQCTEPVEAQLDLRALLLEPVQRPMRYPMLLDRYIAEIGAGHSDFASARRAADTVLESLKELEKSLRDFSAFQERLQLLRSVTFPTALAPYWEEFAHSCLRHGRAWQGDKPRYLLLSRRTLLICSPGRFRQEAWTAKRALPVPGDLRVLGCEGRLLRMDTDSDARLQLEFGARNASAPEDQEASGSGKVSVSSVSSDCGSDGVRECRDWAMELRRLGVPFMDSPAEGDDRLLPWERAAGRTGRPVMTPLDKATRCQGCGAAYRPLQRRRLSCRVCGGAFCSDCTDYQARTSWGGDRPLRCCFFCRVAAGSDPAELNSDRHRQLLALFRSVRELDSNPESLKGHVTAWLSGRWVSLWCRVDSEGRRLALYKHRRDFLPQLTVQQPRLRSEVAASNDDAGGSAGDPAELLVHDHQRRRDCRLRPGQCSEDGGLLRKLAGLLGRCADELETAGSADCVDGSQSAPAALSLTSISLLSPAPSPLASLSPSPLPFGDDLELIPETW